MPNSVGKTDRDVRKFIREMGGVANKANVERIGREIRRTEQENERVEKIAKEVGFGTQDERGPVEERVRRKVLREQARRGR